MFEQILIEAAKSGNVALIQRGIALGLLTGGLPQTLLHWAVMSNQPAVVAVIRSFHQHCYYPCLNINYRSGNGATLLIYAASLGYEEIVKELLRFREIERGAVDYSGKTALMYAVNNNQTRVLDVFLGLDIDVNTQDVFGRTALSYACENGSKSAVEMLLGLEEPAPLLDRTDVQPNWCDHSGLTPLHWAVLGNKPEIVRTLLKRADVLVNPTTLDYSTPLELARRFNFAEVAAILQQSGGRVCCRQPIILAQSDPKRFNHSNQDKENGKRLRMNT